MNVRLNGNGISGEVRAIPSKSDVHRALICAALADKKSRVNFSATSEDINATVSCLNSLGAKITLDGGGADVIPIGKNLNKNATLDCGESGSTIRFMIPVAAALGADSSFTGRGRLAQRPIEPLATVMKQNGCTFSKQGEFPLKVGGQLKSTEFEIEGNVSSQFITGLLFALPLIGGGKIKILPPVESKKYIDMTVRTMGEFGVNVSVEGTTYTVDSSSRYTVLNEVYSSDGDWSNAAFFLSAAAIKGNIKYTGVFKNSLQGDKEIVNLLSRFGAEVIWEDDSVFVKSNELHSIDIDASQIPDLVPILSVVAAFAKGETKIYNAGRLRIKESDRLSAVATALNTLGTDVTELEDSLIIKGNPDACLSGCVDSFNDHRMVMSCAVAALCSGGEITVENAQAVNKSYPLFFEDFILLGGKCDVL
ncbi:MAG: 3-phosphoshikimate 1-carboxyvinyltransferase [Clostridia bacterium]|nr:3-phosphoshikimate 1-carboxyvinyltransferase [Clostridia bacterium]